MRFPLYILIFPGFSFNSCIRKTDKRVEVQDVKLEGVGSSEMKEPMPPPPPNLNKQSDTSILNLEKEITLVGIIEQFKREQHRIDTCRDDLNNSTSVRSIICRGMERIEG